MLEEYGGLETAKRLLAKTESQPGLYRLWELDLLQGSMEAVVLRKKFTQLFSESELAEASRRLTDLGYYDQ